MQLQAAPGVSVPAMPIKPLRGGEPIPLDSPDDVAALVGHLSRGDREPAWLGTHFAYLA
nr:hypothetical protein GCM10020092_094590 [Actinoplanes digitatis]